MTSKEAFEVGKRRAQSCGECFKEEGRVTHVWHCWDIDSEEDREVSLGSGHLGFLGDPAKKKLGRVVQERLERVKSEFEIEEVESSIWRHISVAESQEKDLY